MAAAILVVLESFHGGEPSSTLTSHRMLRVEVHHMALHVCLLGERTRTERAGEWLSLEMDLKDVSTDVRGKCVGLLADGTLRWLQAQEHHVSGC